MTPVPSRWFVPAVLGVLAGLTVLLAGCGGGPGGGGSTNREEKYRAYAQSYGELLMNKDFQAAYALCSSHLKKKMTLEKFTAEHKQAWKELGAPGKFDVSINFVKPELLKDQKGWPEGADRQARVFVNFFTDKDAKYAGGDYALALNIVQEDGKDLVAVFDYGIH